MEWSKSKTMKLIGLMQANATWNPALYDSGKYKIKRKKELRLVSDALGICVSDITKKIQHLRSQYNREYTKECRAHMENPNDSYVSNWYAYEYLHFLKDPNRPFSSIHSDKLHSEALSVNADSVAECKIDNYTPGTKVSQLDIPTRPADIVYISHQDDLSIFGEYIANELRSLNGEKILLVAKKQIQDVIFKVKMRLINESGTEQNSCTLGNKSLSGEIKVHNSKLYNALCSNVDVEHLPGADTPPTSSISEIIID